MKTYQKIIAYGALVAGSLGLFGCEDPKGKVGDAYGGNLGQPMVAVGDLNGDERKDIIIGNANGIYLLLNNGNGKFSDPRKVGDAYGGNLGQPSVAIGDVTGDGLEDIIVGNANGVVVLENKGNNRFNPLE